MQFASRLRRDLIDSDLQKAPFPTISWQIDTSSTVHHTHLPPRPYWGVSHDIRRALVPVTQLAIQKALSPHLRLAKTKPFGMKWKKDATNSNKNLNAWIILQPLFFPNTFNCWIPRLKRLAVKVWPPEAPHGRWKPSVPPQLAAKNPNEKEDVVCLNLFLYLQIWESGALGREMANKWKPCKARVCSFGPLINVFVLSLCFSCYICKTTQVDAEFPHHLSVKGSHSAQFEKWHTRQVALLWEAGCLSHWSSRSWHVSDFCFRKAAWIANLPLALQGTLSQP